MTLFWRSFSVLLLYSLTQFSGQAQEWNWLIKGNGITSLTGQSNTIRNVTQSNNGFLYITGNFRDSLIIDQDTLISTAFEDAFVAKFDTLENLIWIKQFSSTGSTDCKGLAINNDGKIVLGGYFQNDLTYNNSLNLSAPGASELFIVWLNELGNVIQYEHTTGGNYAEVFDLAIDQDNNVLITGNFLGPLTRDNVNLNATAGLNFFCIKVTPNGYFEWGKQSVGGGNLSSAIALDNENNIYLTGSFEDGAIIGGTPYTSANGNHNLYVTKYTTNGTNEWVYTMTGFDEVHGNGIQVNPKNTIGVIGEFRQVAEIGTDTLVQSQGAYDIVFFTLSKTGDYLKAQTFGGINNDIPTDIDDDFYGNFIITGKFGHNVDFGDTSISATGTANTFVLKTDQDHLKWIKTIPGTGLNEGLCLHYGLNENIYIGGTIRNSIYLGDDSYNAPSGKDFYLVELSDSINHDNYLTIQNNIANFTVFPNPTQGQIQIQTNASITQIQVLNLHGQIVFESQTLANHLHSIDLSHLQNGIYILTLFENKNISTSKIVIQN